MWEAEVPGEGKERCPEDRRKMGRGAEDPGLYKVASSLPTSARMQLACCQTGGVPVSARYTAQCPAPTDTRTDYRTAHSRAGISPGGVSFPVKDGHLGWKPWEATGM